MRTRLTDLDDKQADPVIHSADSTLGGVYGIDSRCMTHIDGGQTLPRPLPQNDEAVAVSNPTTKAAHGPGTTRRPKG
jgi:hypothetical protein